MYIYLFGMCRLILYNFTPIHIIFARTFEYFMKVLTIGALKQYHANTTVWVFLTSTSCSRTSYNEQVNLKMIKTYLRGHRHFLSSFAVAQSTEPYPTIYPVTTISSKRSQAQSDCHWKWGSQACELVRGVLLGQSSLWVGMGGSIDRIEQAMFLGLRELGLMILFQNRLENNAWRIIWTRTFKGILWDFFIFTLEQIIVLNKYCT